MKKIILLAVVVSLISIAVAQSQELGCCKYFLWGCKNSTQGGCGWPNTFYSGQRCIEGSCSSGTLSQPESQPEDQCECHTLGLTAPIIIPSQPASNQQFQIKCTYTNGGKSGDSCMRAYEKAPKGGTYFSCTFNSWVSPYQQAIFDCEGLPAGTYTASCVIDSGEDAGCCCPETPKTTVYRVVQATTTTIYQTTTTLQTTTTEPTAAPTTTTLTTTTSTTTTTLPPLADWGDLSCSQISDFLPIRASKNPYTKYILGNEIDYEYQPEQNDGDDGVTIDGIPFEGKTLKKGQSYTLEIKTVGHGGNGWSKLTGWVDWDGQGANPPVIIIDNVLQPNNTFYYLNINVPENAKETVCFRFTNKYYIGMNQSYNSNILGGEVEDYVVNIVLPAHLKVFVSSQTYNGNLGGLSGADVKCQGLANTANLQGTFKAWLSTSTVNAKDRFISKNLPYYTVNGIKVADNFNDLIDGSLDNPINVDEKGKIVSYSVWTGTKTNGEKETSNLCNDWMIDSPNYRGRTGDSSSYTDSWTYWNKPTCDNNVRLYCFQDIISTPTTTIPTTTRPSTTTRTSTTQITPTTIIPINPPYLFCDRDTINAGENNTCYIYNCNSGFWLIAGEPLGSYMFENIPPTSITFGPATTSGLIETYAWCCNEGSGSSLNSFMCDVLNHITTVIGQSPPSQHNLEIKLKGDYDQSYEYSNISIDGKKIGDACTSACSLCEPSVGFTANINLDQYCSDDGKLQVTFADSSGVNKDCNAVHEACIYANDKWNCCSLPCGDYGCTNSVIFDCDNWQCPEQEDFMIDSVNCNKNKCSVKIIKNELNEELEIYVYLIEEPSGKIYYSGSETLDENYTGIKDVSLSKLSTCPSGTQLKALIAVYDEDLNNIYNKKGDGFTCT